MEKISSPKPTHQLTKQTPLVSLGQMAYFSCGHSCKGVGSCHSQYSPSTKAVPLEVVIYFHCLIIAMYLMPPSFKASKKIYFLVQSFKLTSLPILWIGIYSDSEKSIFFLLHFLILLPENIVRKNTCTPLVYSVLHVFSSIISMFWIYLWM